MSKHTLVATVEEGPVVLNRVLSLFRQRSFAIESLSIGRTNEPGIMRLTMVVDGARSAVDGGCEVEIDAVAEVFELDAGDFVFDGGGQVLKRLGTHLAMVVEHLSDDGRL